MVSAVMPLAANAATDDTKFVLAEEGEARAVIVVARNPDVTHVDLDEGNWRGRTWRGRARVDAWAHFLAERLEQATGAPFRIVTDDAVPNVGGLILVGTSVTSRRYGFSGEGMRPEEARVTTFDRGVALFGERVRADAPHGHCMTYRDLSRGAVSLPVASWIDRGTGHAVTWFLEKHVGFRFFFPSDPEVLGTVVPKRATLAVPTSGSDTFAPWFRFRHARVGFSPGISPAVYAYRTGISVDLAVNHVYNLHREHHPARDDLFAKGPDGSPMYDRKLGCPPCYAAPEYLNLYLKHIDLFDRTGRRTYAHGVAGRLIAAPGRVYVGPHDGRWLDHDPRALPWHRKGSPLGVQSDLIGQFASSLASRVAHHWPGRRVKLMMQNNYAAAPSAHIDLPTNVDVMACLSLRPTPMASDREAMRVLDTFVDQWYRKLGRDPTRLALADYNRPGKWAVHPVYHPHVLQRFLQHHAAKFSGCWVMGFGHRRIALPMEAMWMELLWDPTLDPEAWWLDFCKQMFGPAAAPMHAILIEAARAWEHPGQGLRTRGNRVPESLVRKYVFPAATVQRMAVRMQTALGLAEKAEDSIYRQRIDHLLDSRGGTGFAAFFEWGR